VQAISRQSRLELIYVDSASTDDSVGTAASCGALVVSLDAGPPSAARARNAGWRAATASLILFLDGDTILNSGFLEPALRIIQDPSVAVVWGKRTEIFPEQSIYTRVLDLDWVSSPPGDSAYCGGDALMRRSVLEETGGYDDELIAGEEPELCRRIRSRGYRIVSAGIAITQHDLAVTRWSQYWKRSVRTGHAYAEVSERFRKTPDPLWRTEHIRNLVQGLSYVALAAVGLSASLIAGSVWPIVAVFLIFLALIFRTAYRHRNKPVSIGHLIAYGVHSHIQQIPILVGQFGYWRSRLAGKRRALIEYQTAKR
jgi:GT2 family glycosyltransferase